jgi:hypothetical protein
MMMMMMSSFGKTLTYSLQTPNSYIKPLSVVAEVGMSKV